MDVGEAIQNALIGHAELELGDSITQAFMHTVTKGQMFIHIIPSHIKDIGMGEHIWIAIGRAIPHNHFLILGNALTRQFGIFHGSAPHMHYR